MTYNKNNLSQPTSFVGELVGWLRYFFLPVHFNVEQEIWLIAFRKDKLILISLF